MATGETPSTETTPIYDQTVAYFRQQAEDDRLTDRLRSIAESQDPVPQLVVDAAKGLIPGDPIRKPADNVRYLPSRKREG